jgi:hypothetical protein
MGSAHETRLRGLWSGPAGSCAAGGSYAGGWVVVVGAVTLWLRIWLVRRDPSARAREKGAGSRLSTTVEN